MKKNLLLAGLFASAMAGPVLTSCNGYGSAGRRKRQWVQR